MIFKLYNFYFKIGDCDFLKTIMFGERIFTAEKHCNPEPMDELNLQ